MLPANTCFLIVTCILTGFGGLVVGQAHADDKSCQRHLTAPISPKERTQILVLATPHLESFGDRFDPGALDALVEVLVRFRPDIIGVEAMPPDVIGSMKLRNETFGPIVEQFAKKRVELASQAQKKLNVKWREAWGKIEKRFFRAPQANAKSMAVRERLALIINLLAAHDLYGAVLHWSYLSESERASQAILPRAIVEELNLQLDSSNEIVSIGIRAAVRLGLGRIDYIDDFTIGPLLLGIAPKLMSQAKDLPVFHEASKSPIYAETSKSQESAVASGDLLPHYLFLNSPDYAARDVDAQWKVFFRMHLESGLDRTRVALWEIRNLKLVSHIRRATAFAPGRRMLVIVGAGHKPFLDRYLCQLMDVEIVQLAGLVADEP